MRSRPGLREAPRRAARGRDAGVTPSADPDAGVPPAARAAILAWYVEHGRRLSFRASSDPYGVLVSEVMAQQTQAERAADAWSPWMAAWPTVEALAAAPAADVLRAWAGLGYNRRALALHRAARAIVADHGGRVPGDVAALEALPGVGPYTARAVAAIAFGQPVGAVDTNVRRVLGRVAAGGPEGISTAGLQALADDVVPRGRAAAWTHALMDLGAMRCRPRAPRCEACPAAPWCRYAAGERAVTAVERSSRPRRPEPAFPATTRWLRGRVLERARDAADGGWVGYGGPIGSHDAAAVREAVLSLAADGLLEAREDGGVPEARLPG